MLSPREVRFILNCPQMIQGDMEVSGWHWTLNPWANAANEGHWWKDPWSLWREPTTDKYTLTDVWVKLSAKSVAKHMNLLIGSREGAIPVKVTILAAKVNIATLSWGINTTSGRCQSLQRLSPQGQVVWSATRSDSGITHRVKSAWSTRWQKRWNWKRERNRLLDWPCHELKTQ